MKILIGVLFFASSYFGTAFAEDNTLKAKVEIESDSTSMSGISPGQGFSNTVCKNGGNTRTVELISSNPETKLPCEIHYKKETEQAAHDQVLWSAQNDLTFCYAKAAAFVDKLTGMGWTCTTN